MRILNTEIKRDYFYGDIYYTVWVNYGNVTTQVTFKKPYLGKWFAECGYHKDLTVKTLIPAAKEIAMKTVREYKRWYK